MSDQQWSRVKQVFDEALSLSGAQQDAFVDSACGGDPEMLAQVRALLRAHREAGDFMEQPAATEELPEGPGSRIGRYKLLQSIGEGGFGEVFMAEQEEPIRRRVALKIIKLGMDTKEVIARFEAERQALAMMDHPNIAKVLDAGATESGRPFFVMELVRGIPITEYCDTNRLDTRERLQLFVDVCRAVHHAHEKGIVHRDIKPSNVLVTLHDGTPVPMVIDFGIAKATNQRLTEKTLFTAFGQFIGTPAYMSPEQAGLSNEEVDRRSDVFSLGVLLYELLTGTTPLQADALRSAAFVEMLRIIREVDPPTPSDRLQTLGDRVNEIASRRRVEPGALARLLRGDLDWIALHAMEKDRRRRYSSAADFAADVERYFRHDPVVARQPSVAYRMRKFTKRHRSPLVATAAIVLAVLLGGALGHRGPFARAGSGMVAPTRRLAWDSAGSSGSGRTTRDGKHRLRYNNEQRGFELVDLDTRATRLLTRDGPDSTSGLPFDPILSSDDRSIAAMTLFGPAARSDRAELRVFDVNSSGQGRKVAVWPGPLRYATVFAFDSRARKLWTYVLRFDLTAEIAWVDLASGKVNVVKRFARRLRTQPPSLSPDGRFLTFEDADSVAAPPDIFILPTDGRPAVRLEHPSRDALPAFAPDGSGVVFLSNRDGQNDLWFQPLADGHASSEPRKVWADVSPYGQTQVFADNGSLFYYFAGNVSEVYTAKIDLEDQAVSAPQLVAPRSGDVNAAPEFSPDGQFLAHLRDRSRRVVLRHLATGEEREYPLPVGVTAGTIDFCPDGQTLLVSGYKQPHAVALRVQLNRGHVDEIDMGLRPSRPVCIGDAMIYLRYNGPDSASIVRRTFATGGEVTLFRGATGGLFRSPKADRVAFNVLTDSDRVYVMSLHGGEPKLVATAPALPPGPLVLSEIQGVMWTPDGDALLLARTPLAQVSAESPEVVFWRVPINGALATEAGRMRLPAHKGAMWGANNYSLHTSGRSIAFERNAGFVAQEWAIDNLMAFIQSGRSVAAPARQ
jgi:serine/threonine protein kinase